MKSLRQICVPGNNDGSPVDVYYETPLFAITRVIGTGKGELTPTRITVTFLPCGRTIAWEYKPGMLKQIIQYVTRLQAIADEYPHMDWNCVKSSYDLPLEVRTRLRNCKTAFQEECG